MLKICGMKFPENIREIEQVRPDWMGFIFYPRSPRFIADLSPLDMPESVNTVGVFVNESIAFVREKVQQYNLSAVQLHGHESPEYCADLSGLDIPVWKAFGVDDEFDFQVCLAYSPYCKYFLFDTKSQQFGGSGKVFSWEKLSDYHGDTPFFLSGGISPANMSFLPSFSHPRLAGIDVNSGFEDYPGFKNFSKLNLLKSEIFS